MKNKTPSITYALLSLVLVIGTIIVSLRLGINTQTSLFFATIVATIVALSLKNEWLVIQKAMVNNVAESLMAIFILLFVGMLVAVWNVGGTLPSLIYYGIKFINPSIIIPLAFLLCCVTSIFTGTSFGSIATMGLVIYGIGTSIGVSPAILAGSIVSGSCFGDKMSPMSDTTNLASSMSGVDIYKHIGSMLYTTLPATVITLVIYTILGLQFDVTAIDSAQIELMAQTLDATFNISLITVLPLLIVLILTAFKVPALIALSLSIVTSMAFAIITQGASIVDISSACLSGSSIRTGLSEIDSILSRGGMTSMIGTIVSICFACAMGGALMVSKVLYVVIDEGLLKLIKSGKALILTTMGYCYATSLVTGSQALGIILPAKTFATSYDKANIDRRVLSRTLEDTSTLISPLIPWSGFTMYVCATLGVGIEYIPYACLNYIVPVFSIVCVATGFGIWDSNGNKLGINDEIKSECWSC